MGMTISEKILAKHSGKKEVVQGDYVNAKVDLSYLQHDLAAYITNGFKEIGVKKVHDPDKILVVIDSKVPPTSQAGAQEARMLREFVKEQSIKHFYDVGRQGVGHQIVSEKGLVRPGTIVVSHDTHAPVGGALGALSVATGIDLIRTLITGETWFRVPESLKINLTGSFSKGVMARDLITRILGDLSPHGALYKILEFAGPAAETMSIDGRMSVCCETVFCGAKSGIFNPDQMIINYVKERTNESFEAIWSDPDATYDDSFDYDISKIDPQVATPPHPTNAKNIAEVEGIEIDQAVIGTCAGGRLEDLRNAARVLKGRQVHPRVRMYITPISQEIYANALKEGLLDIFLHAETQILPMGCQGCIQRLAPGEVSIANITHNHPERHGKGSKTYLASAYTVAASAVEGKITDPRKFL